MKELHRLWIFVFFYLSYAQQPGWFVVILCYDQVFNIIERAFLIALATAFVCVYMCMYMRVE